MSWFQLDPAALAERVHAAQATASVPSLTASLLRGVIGFTVISVAGFAPWALCGRWFHRKIGEAGLYAVCAMVFIGLSGLLLHPLVIGPDSLARFYQIFSIAFAAYAVAWIVGWMTLRGHRGGFTGLLAGTILMGWILTSAFEARDSIVKVSAALFIFNALGYFIGGWIEGCLAPRKEFCILGRPVPKSAYLTLAKLQWGVCYGAGFGAGLGLAFYLCQERARALLGAN